MNSMKHLQLQSRIRALVTMPEMEPAICALALATALVRQAPLPISKQWVDPVAGYDERVRGPLLEKGDAFAEHIPICRLMFQEFLRVLWLMRFDAMWPNTDWVIVPEGEVKFLGQYTRFDAWASAEIKQLCDQYAREILLIANWIAEIEQG